ncbi:DUF2800 domain-containing protein [Bacillus thuringiensis]
MSKEHSSRAHAYLSASGASRWLNCPPSAKLQNTSQKSSVYADEGTAAHELSEIKLQQRLFKNDPIRKGSLNEELSSFVESNKYFNAEMNNATDDYVLYVEERFNSALEKSDDPVILLEARLDFSDWVPEGYGTGDVVIVADGTLEVIDLKYGKGVPVSAVNNPQIRLYALGAWATHGWLYDIDEVRMTIVQPRLDNIDTEILTLKELLDWGKDFVTPRARQAFDGEGEFKAGSHCRWCNVKGNCRARADENMRVLAHEFKEPDLLSDDEVGSILFVAEQLKAWANDVEAYARERVLNGNKLANWKLVEGRRSRTIRDKEEAVRLLGASDIGKDDYLKPRELLGIGELEKRIGKKELAELLGDLVVKSSGKPTLVPETDRRPELNSVNSDFANEEF